MLQKFTFDKKSNAYVNKNNHRKVVDNMLSILLQFIFMVFCVLLLPYVGLVILTLFSILLYKLNKWLDRVLDKIKPIDKN